MLGQLAMAMLIMIGGALSTGCSTLPSSVSSAPPVVATGSQPQYLVDMQLGYGGSKTYKGVIGPGMTVQAAIEASGATRKFRKMDVKVMRKVDGDYRPLKMSCDYNAATRTISPESDYALKDGDRVLITSTSEKNFLQMLGTFADGK